MDELIEPVLEAFTDVDFEIQGAASYVQFYTKQSQNIVLVYIKGKMIATNAISKDNKNMKEELELTGSPLKLDLSLHLVLDETLLVDEPQLWLKEEACHTPLKIEKARQVANLYNELLQEHEESSIIPMWILCDPRSNGKPLLLSIQSYKNHFRRGIVNYEGSVLLQNIDINGLIKKFLAMAAVEDEAVNVVVDCKYLLAGMSYDSSKSLEELLNAPHIGSTNLLCEWKSRSLLPPVMNCTVQLEQEVIVGHLSSPCNSIWKSIAAMYSINQLLVDMTAAGFANVDLEEVLIRKSHITLQSIDNSKRLSNLLKEVEIYTYMVKRQRGGFLGTTDKCISLKECLDKINKSGSSNDFTYRLWDILKDSETAEELLTLLIQALKVISSGKMKPFIDANNKTYLGKLVLKLSRGHSQTGKVLHNLRSNPPQAFTLVGQVGVEKTIWEFTNLMSLVEHSFFIAGIWSSEVITNESIEQINQTIYEMTMGGDYTLNPFDNKTPETSIRIDCESIYEENDHELTVDDFASLKKLGLTEKKPSNEVPLIVDEIDISGWKNLLMKFAQVFVCLEHLNRAQDCLSSDFATLKPLATRLREYYVADKSPIRTVGQLMNDPVQKILLPIDNSIVKDHLIKPAYWYRILLTSSAEPVEETLYRDVAVTHLFTQQPVFPPSVWQFLGKKSKYPPWFSRSLIKIIKEKAKFHKKWKIYGNLQDYDTFSLLRKRQKKIQNECLNRHLAIKQAIEINTGEQSSDATMLSSDIKYYHTEYTFVSNQFATPAKV